MPHDIVIISAGKFAREVFCWAEHAIAAGQPWRMKGFLDDRAHALDGFDYPARVLGGVENYQPAETDLFLCAIGDPKIKRRYSELVLQRGGKFATLVHPTASLGRNIVLADGVIIAPMVVLSSDLSIGQGSYVGPHAGCSHDNKIGAWCQISGGTALGGMVTIGDSCFIGMHATVVPGITIGAGAFVGTGSVVLRNVKPNIKVFGNPAVSIGTVDA